MLSHVTCIVMHHFIRPFDATHYEEENEDDDAVDEEGRNRLKLKVIKIIYFVCLKHYYYCLIN